ncbi:MscL family protein [Nocardioides sp. HDW12B]|uniref:MscL family protein n=1 Tax=Nocardioides sp. HDW12B TaxID=2714939 RepID=UPI00140BD11A|nr:MscL family protein [Nocardioides sp. HDW12B]QIK65273.1 MscL family protein [Nocardioides sp. HDW12B]
MSGFKAFILRGNLVELAVAFIIGASFATVVTTFTAVIMGFVSRIFGGSPNFDSFTIWKDETGVGIPVGAFLTALIAFVILAAVVYFFVVTPYTRAKEKFFPSPSEEPAGTPEDIALLTEIRDALVSRNAGSAGGYGSTGTGTTPPPTA